VSESIALFQRPFYFLRHGETALNANRIIAGSIDTELTETGRRQAIHAGEILAGHPITGVYTSTLRRTRDTAAPIAGILKVPVIVVAELAERKWGVLEGRPRGTRMPGVTPEGAESAEEFTQRVLAGLAKIDTRVPLIVGHSGVFRVLCRALGIVETEAPVTNALPLRLEPHPGGGWKLIPLSEGSPP
jgi:probable phosphoglycerate mutase